MKKEIRGILAGQYLSEDGIIVLNIKRNDENFMFDFIDRESDICYEIIIDKDNKLKYNIKQIDYNEK